MHMSPALNGSSVIRRFERSDAIEICDGIIFDFYTGLSHNAMYILSNKHLSVTAHKTATEITCIGWSNA